MPLTIAVGMSVDLLAVHTQLNFNNLWGEKSGLFVLPCAQKDPNSDLDKYKNSFCISSILDRQQWQAPFGTKKEGRRKENDRGVDVIRRISSVYFKLFSNL